MVLNVLIVDDSSTMRAMIKRAFTLNGFPVARYFEAADGAEGLELLEHEEIDLVMVDINMPVMSGMEMIDRIREIPEVAQVPVVVVSTFSSEARIREIRNKDVEYIKKPFTPEQFRNVIEPMLEKLEDAVD
jgi:two-component system chemotaxis response regulator CheY